MRVLAAPLYGALLIVASVVSSDTSAQVSADRAATNMNRGMSGGIFSVQGKKPTKRIAQGASASPSEPTVTRIGSDGGPMKVPTYRLPNGVVLQATEGIKPAYGVTCIAYCRPIIVTRL